MGSLGRLSSPATPLELFPYQIPVTLTGSGGVAYRRPHKGQEIDVFATSMKVGEWEACRCVTLSVSPGASCLVDWLLEERVYLAMETIVSELCYLGN